MPIIRNNQTGVIYEIDQASYDFFLQNSPQDVEVLDVDAVARFQVHMIMTMISYADLKDLKDNDQLVPLNYYLIEDATAIGNAVVVPAGIPLIVQAVSENQISSAAMSPDYAQDSIGYNFDTDTIVFRKDNYTDIAVHQDLRNLSGLSIGSGCSNIYLAAGVTGTIGNGCSYISIEIPFAIKIADEVSEISLQSRTKLCPEVFGANPSASTVDNNVAINDACAYLGTQGGGTLYFKSGKTYYYSAPMISAVNIIWEGNGATLKRINEIRSALTADVTTGNTTVSVTDATGFKAGMSCRLYKASYGETGYNTSRLTITGISGNTITFSGTVSASFETGDMFITASSGVQLADNNVFENFIMDGNSSGNPSFQRWDCQNEVSGTSGSPAYTVRSNKFINSTAEGIVTFGQNVLIEGNNFLNIQGNAIHFSGITGCIVSNNTIVNTNLGDNSKIGHVGGAISFSDVNKDILVTDNYIENGWNGIGYLYGSVASVNHFNCDISENTIKSCRNRSVDLRSTAAGIRFDDINISNNKIYNSGALYIESTAASIAKRKCKINGNKIYNGSIACTYGEDIIIDGNSVFNDVNIPYSSLVSDDTTTLCISIIPDTSKNVIVTNNITYAGRYGIYIAGTSKTDQKIVIKGNSSYKSYEAGIFTDTQGSNYNVIISNNYITSETGASANWDGILVRSGTLVNNNEIVASAGRSCVYLANNGPCFIHKNVLLTSSSGIYAVSGPGGATGHEIVGNIINSTIRTQGITPANNYIYDNSFLGIRTSGTAILIDGVAVVGITALNNAQQVFITRTANGGTIGELTVTKIPGTGFTITSSSNTETSAIDWKII